jgi:HK97 family phage portal protein
MNDPMSLSAVFAAINLISNSIATLPINIISLSHDYEVKDNYVMSAMRQSPLSKFIFMKQIVKDLLIYGNAYAIILRDKDGKPKQFGYLQPSEVTPYYSANDFFVQYYSSPKIKKAKILPKDMIHLVMNSKDGIMGRGVLDFANESIETAQYVESTAKNYFKGNTQTTGVLTVQTDNPNINISDKKLQELKDAWNSGSSKTGAGSTTRILPANMKYQSISGNAQETQLTQTRLYDIQEIARFFNISPILLGDYSKLAYSSIEAAQLEFILHCLVPYIELIQDEFSRKIVPVELQDKELVNLDETFLLKADKATLANYLNTLTKGGIITINEARNQLGYDRIDNGMADELIIPYTDVNQNVVGNTTNEEYTDNTNTTQEKDEEE